MKNIAIISLVFVLGFALAGCGKNKAAPANQNQQTNQTQESGGENNKMGKKISDVMKQGQYVGKQIAEALQRNERLKCTYKVSSDDEEMLTEVYMEGEKYRSKMTSGGEEINVIYDGKVHYNWTASTKKGMKMESSCLEELQTPDEPEQVEDVDLDIDQYKTTDEILQEEVEMSCDKTGPIDFSPPSDVDFMDQCEMLKKQMEMVEQMQNSMPEEYLQQMQQMQNIQ
jgi:predicted small lipoprotein YifL